MKCTTYYCDFCGREIEDLSQAVEYEVSIGRLTNKKTYQIDTHSICVELFLMHVMHKRLISADDERKEEEHEQQSKG